MPRSNKRVELKMGNGNDMLVTNMGAFLFSRVGGGGVLVVASKL